MRHVRKLAHRQAQFGEALVFRLDILDRHRQMAVTVSKVVGFRTIAVDRQFQFETGLLTISCPILHSSRYRIMPRAERDAATLESVRLFNEETRLLDMM